MLVFLKPCKYHCLDQLITTNAAQCITEYDVTEIIIIAHYKPASVGNYFNAFKIMKCCTVNLSIFDEGACQWFQLCKWIKHSYTRFNNKTKDSKQNVTPSSFYCGSYPKASDGDERLKQQLIEEYKEPQCTAAENILNINVKDWFMIQCITC